MTRDVVTAKLTEIFRDIFEEDDIVVTDETTAQDIEGWDSLTHLSMISEVESEFKMRFKMKEITAMKNVGEMITIICERAK
ncbi:MAG: acyl carrier protein [Ruminococcaceae bacterium]|nr:acyl carrier protein [Oscillospiraceae bacterium]